MSTLQRLVRREIDTQRQTIIGTVIKNPNLVDFDGNSTGVWVVDVEIGKNNRLIDVPVKANDTRFYAQLGQTVSLRRNAQGRYEVTGPGDRVSTAVEEIAYDLATKAGGTPVEFGFSYLRVPFSYYATLDANATLGTFWNDGVTPFNLVQTIDAQGNPVP